MIKKLFTPEEPQILRQYEVVNGKWHVHGRTFDEMTLDQRRILERCVKTPQMNLEIV